MKKEDVALKFMKLVVTANAFKDKPLTNEHIVDLMLYAYEEGKKDLRSKLK